MNRKQVTHEQRRQKRLSAYNFYKEQMPEQPKYGDSVQAIRKVMKKFGYASEAVVRNLISNIEKQNQTRKQ